MADDGQWEEALLSQLATRNVLQCVYFREVLSVHGQTSSDERQYRRVAQAAPAPEAHNAVLLENADLQRRLQEAEQRVDELSAENSALKEKILESKQRDAETLNELTGNLEYYRQQQVLDTAATAGADLLPASVAPPAVETSRVLSTGKTTLQEVSLPPMVRMVEIVETGKGYDEYTGQEYTTYVMRCTGAADATETPPGSQGAQKDVALAADASDANSLVSPSPPAAAIQWSLSKRFSDFSNLRAELAALPTIGAAIETMDFPPSTWNFLPWGAGKLDEETITARRTGLQSWMNSVLGTYPTEAAVRRFLQDPASIMSETEPEPAPAQELIALWSFEPPSGQEGTHVALRKGEKVRLLKEVSADWWFVEVANQVEGHRRGYVPASYMRRDGQ